MKQEIKNKILELISAYNEEEVYDTMEYMKAERTLKKLKEEETMSKIEVKEAFRDFKREDIDEIRKVWPNFGYNEENENLNDDMVNQINLVFKKRLKDLRLE